MDTASRVYFKPNEFKSVSLDFIVKAGWVIYQRIPDSYLN